MTAADSYIFGNSALHRRFCLFTEILGKFVSAAPRAVTMGELAMLTGLSATEVAKICADLSRSELVRPVTHRAGGWELACEPSIVTLEDVYRCAIAERPQRAKAAKVAQAAAEPASTLHHDVDLLIMQATMAINQSVFRHLRQFSLDRLKVAAAAVFPGSVESSFRYYDSNRSGIGAL